MPAQGSEPAAALVCVCDLGNRNWNPTTVIPSLAPVCHA
jgi:hypothetical protein